jgi:hypothetical protein
MLLGGYLIVGLSFTIALFPESATSSNYFLPPLWMIPIIPFVLLPILFAHWNTGAFHPPAVMFGLFAPIIVLTMVSVSVTFASILGHAPNRFRSFVSTVIYSLATTPTGLVAGCAILVVWPGVPLLSSALTALFGNCTNP